MSTFVRLFAGSLVAVVLGAGCAELITYSNKAYDEGQKLEAQGRYDDAAGAYRNATTQDPRHYKSFYALGEVYGKLGREQQALQSYRAAVDVGPSWDSKEPADVAFREKAVNGLAEYVAQSASRDAEITALTERAQRSGKPLDWYVLAKTYAAAGDADNAIDAYDRALLAGGSRYAQMTRSFGLYLVQVNQAKRAESVLVKAYQLNPADTEVSAALTRLGVVPGPSLLEPDQLNRPLVPKGPLPEIEVNVKDRSRD